MKIRKENIGSRCEDWLKEQDIHEQVTFVAIKRAIADQIEEAMAKEHVSKTSRASLDRLLDPDNDAVPLNTLFKAASAIGGQIRLELF